MTTSTDSRVMIVAHFLAGAATVPRRAKACTSGHMEELVVSCFP